MANQRHLLIVTVLGGSVLTLMFGCDPDLDDSDNRLTGTYDCTVPPSDPQPVETEWVEGTCGAKISQADAYPDVDGALLAVGGNTACEDGTGLRQPIQILDEALDPVWTLQWWSDDSAALRASPTVTDGPWLAVMSTDRAKFFDVTSGAELGSVVLENIDLTFVGEKVAVADYGDDRQTGVVYILDVPGDSVSAEDVGVVHHSPSTCVGCGFGTTLTGIGDVTGDGVSDLVVGGGSLWFAEGELLDVDEGVANATWINAQATQTHDAISNIGDFDGDGIGDYMILSETSGAQLMAGGAEAPFAWVANSDDDDVSVSIHHAADYLGDLDGDGYDTVAIEGVAGIDETTRFFLVEAPIRCGTYDLAVASTELEVDWGLQGGAMESGEMTAAPGILAMTTHELVGTPPTAVWTGLRVKRW